MSLPQGLKQETVSLGLHRVERLRQGSTIDVYMPGGSLRDVRVRQDGQPAANP